MKDLVRENSLRLYGQVLIIYVETIVWVIAKWNPKGYIVFIFQQHRASERAPPKTNYLKVGEEDQKS